MPQPDPRVLALVDGDPVLYLERGGRTALVFDDDPERLRMIGPPVADVVRAGAAEKLTVERVNGMPALGHGALETAVRVMKETGAQAVKLEGGAERAPIVAALVAAGVVARSRPADAETGGQ